MRQRLPLILSITALVVAILGWTGVGEATRNALVPKNSVGTQQIKNGSIKPVDLARSTKRNLKGKRGPRGAEGPAGPRGPAGPARDAVDLSALKSCVNSNFSKLSGWIQYGGLRPSFQTCF